MFDYLKKKNTLSQFSFGTKFMEGNIFISLKISVITLTIKYHKN